MFSIQSLAWTLLVLAPPHAASSDCLAGTRDVERAVNGTMLTDKAVETFELVAEARLKSGEEALPGLIGCPSISAEAAEVEQDINSARLLRDHALSSTDYVRIAWTIVIASDPEAFEGPGDFDSKILAHNRAVYRLREASLTKLLHAR